MKTTTSLLIISTILAASIASTTLAQTLWIETFGGQLGKGITGGTPPITNMTGITKWNVETTVPFNTNVQNFIVVSNSTIGLVLEANNVKDEVVWQSESIDISTNDFVELTVDLSEVGTLAQSDYVRTYYSVNGQPETMFHENGNISDDFTSAVAKQEAVTGTNLVITIKADNGAKTSRHRFDNITVTAANPASNQPPILVVDPSGTEKSVAADTQISFSLIATEEYLDLADNIILKMVSGPTGSSFSETNGTSALTNNFTWTPDTPGNYTAVFEASDVDGTNSIQVDINVYPGKEIVWLEDFNNPLIDGKGAYGPSNTVDLAGVTNWTIDITNTSLSASTDYFKVKNEQYEAQDIDGEAVWMATNINIVAYNSVSIKINISSAGDFESTDYFRTYYSVDGQPETLFSINGDLTDDFISPIVASQDKLSGNILSIIVRCNNNASTERYYFDNVEVSTPIPQGMFLIIR